MSVAFTAYEAQGLHYIVPSNITLTLAMIVWAYLIRDGRNAWRALLIGVAVLCVSHPVGRLYALMALALYVTAGRWSLTRREWGVVIATLTIIGVYWVFARLSTAPPIDVTLAHFNPEFPTYFDLVAHQLVDVIHKIGDAVQRSTLLPYTALDALLLIGGLFLISNPQRRWRTCVFLILNFGMLIAGAFTSLLSAPNEANRRLILIFLIALTGSLGTLIVWSLGRLSEILMHLFTCRKMKLVAELFFVFFVATVACFTWVLIVGNSVIHHTETVILLTNFENYNLKREDLESLLREPEATILYTNQVALFYSLSNGLHRFKAIDYRVLDTPADLTQVDYIIGLQVNPLIDPLDKLKPLYPNNFIEENFILVEGLKSDLRIYARRP